MVKKVEYISSVNIFNSDAERILRKSFSFDDENGDFSKDYVQLFHRHA